MPISLGWVPAAASEIPRAKGCDLVKVPKYYQVKNQILELIAGLDPGAAVPTERDLAERFGTSRTTLRQAIAELVVDGRLEHTQGRGTFVAQPKLMQVRYGEPVLDVSTSETEWAG